MLHSLRQVTQKIGALAFQLFYSSTWNTADRQEDQDKLIQFRKKLYY